MSHTHSVALSPGGAQRFGSLFSTPLCDDRARHCAKEGSLTKAQRPRGVDVATITTRLARRTRGERPDAVRAAPRQRGVRATERVWHPSGSITRARFCGVAASRSRRRATRPARRAPSNGGSSRRHRDAEATRPHVAVSRRRHRRAARAQHRAKIYTSRARRAPVERFVGAPARCARALDIERSRRAPTPTTRRRAGGGAEVAVRGRGVVRP